MPSPSFNTSPVAGRGLVVVPVYNEGESVGRVSQRLRECDPICDVLYVNDGSRDASGPLLEGLGCDVIHHPINLGYIEALRTGTAVALAEGYEFVLFFDGDGQHRVEDLNALVHHHRAHADDDVLIGFRYLSGERAATLLRHLAGQSFAWMARLATWRAIHDVTCGLKLLNRRAMEILTRTVLEDGHAEFVAFMGRAGCRIRELPIHVEPRTEGVSMYRFPKVVTYPLKTFFLLFLSFLPGR